MSITTTGKRGAAAGLVAAVLTSTLLAATPAHAESGSWSDPDDQTGRTHDLRRAVVHHGAERIVVRSDIDHLSRENVGSMAVYVDTDRSRRGPERVLGGGIFEGTDYSMWRMRDWRYTGQMPLECDYAMQPRYRADVVRVVMDRDCVGNADRMRVAVKVSGGEDGAESDWLGSRREFTRWLTAG